MNFIGTIQLLIFIYTKKSSEYRAMPRPHLGFSNHIPIVMIPSNHNQLKQNKPEQRTVCGPVTLLLCYRTASSGQTDMFSERLPHKKEMWTWRNTH